MTVRLGYELLGPDDAPVAVLGASLGTTRAMWDDVLPSLTRHFRVLRYDHLGHGRSHVPDGPYTVETLADDVVAAMDDAGIAHAHVAGVSLGGMVAMQMAAAHPHRVDTLGLVCTSAHLPPAVMWHDRAATVRTHGMAAVVDTVTTRWFTPAFADSQRADEMRAQFLDVPPEGYAGCCEAIATMDLRPALADIAAPTLVVTGADDPATPSEHATAIADGIAEGGGSAGVVVVPGAHLAAVECPDVVSDALLKHWLAS